MRISTCWSVGLAVSAIIFGGAVVTRGQSAVTTIVASSSEGTAGETYVIPSDSQTVTQGLELRDADSGDLVGTLEDLSVTFVSDDRVQGSFAFKAGATDTTFDMSAMVNVSLTDPMAAATATLSLLANDGGSVNGLLPGNSAFRATYNGGTVFADLLGPLSVAGFGAAAANESFPIPEGTLTAIPGSVSSLEGLFSIEVSANSVATGTWLFQAVPEPTSFVLIVAGASAVLIRRRAHSHTR